MTQEIAFDAAGFTLRPTETGSWTAVLETNPAFYKTYGTNRVGKIIGTKFFITVAELDEPAQQLFKQYGGVVERVKSTSGAKPGVTYPGVDMAAIPEGQWNMLVMALARMVAVPSKS